MTTLQKALRAPIGGRPVIKYVHPLLVRTNRYVVATPVLAAYLGNLLVREQAQHLVEDTVRWTMAMFDVGTMSGTAASRNAWQIGMAVDDYIEDRIAPTDRIELKLAMNAVLHTLEPVYGKQLRVTGWLPGFRVADGRTLLELSGNACPSCTVNPTGYKVGDKSNTARCLNSEQCGWTSA